MTRTQGKGERQKDRTKDRQRIGKDRQRIGQRIRQRRKIEIGCSRSIDWSVKGCGGRPTFTLGKAGKG